MEDIMTNTTQNEAPEILVSIDGEFTGRIPGPNSMISLGAVAYDSTSKEISRFKVNLRELPESTREDATMKWWSEHHEAWKIATENPVEAGEGMSQFARWLNTLPGRPKLMGWPLPVDFMFVYWYYVKFLNDDPPFGYDGIDIKTFAMSRLGTATLSGISTGVSRKMAREVLNIPDSEFSHDPVDDASEQADLYFGLQKLGMSR